MLSKNKIKLITSLKQKKYRQQHQLFVAEGIKTVTELLHSNLQLHELYTTTLEIGVSDDLKTEITEGELKKISFLTTPNQVLAVFKIPEARPIDFNNLVLVLDNIRDPGNLGTIIRLCDWYGIKDLVCSRETVDCYNPKVVQATMGSITRVNISYVNLSETISNKKLDIFGTFMDGKNVYQTPLTHSGILVLGNEANGISDEIASFVTSRIAIPRFGDLKQTESLNVATATAIFLSEFKRRLIEK